MPAADEQRALRDHLCKYDARARDYDRCTTLLGMKMVDAQEPR